MKKEHPNNGLEIVYIDACKTENFYKKSCANMPWFIVPFEATELKTSLYKTFNYRGTNALLILIDVTTGNIITKEGIKIITDFGMEAAPFTEEAIRAVKEPQNEALLHVFSNWTIFEGTDHQPDIDIANLLTKEVVAVLVAKNEGYNKYVQAKIDELHDRLGDTNLAVIYIAYDVLDADIQECDRFFSTTLPSYWLKIRDKNDKFIDAISAAVDDVEELNLFFLSGDSRRLLVPIDNDDDNMNVTDISEHFRLISAAGEVMEGDTAVESLSRLELIGVYFGSFESDISREATNKLTKLYNRLKKQKKDVEIIYVSNDTNITDFLKYSHSMPWLVLDYSQLEYRQAGNQAFNVMDGEPKLVWINIKSGDVNMDGLSTIELGSSYYPWSPEQIEQARKSTSRRSLSASSSSFLNDLSISLNKVGSSCTIS